MSFNKAQINAGQKWQAKNLDAINEFRNNLPENQRDECYQLLSFTFDIAIARFIIQNDKPENVQYASIPVKAWAEYMGLDKKCQSDGISLRMFYVDDARAMTDEIDCSIPVILGSVPCGGKEHESFLIDGTHRLYKAYHSGIERIPAIVLDKLQTSRCLV